MFSRIPFVFCCLALGLTACASAPTAPQGAALLRRADQRFDRRELAAALEQYKMAAAAAKEEDERQLAAEAMSQVAHVHGLLGDVEEGRPWLGFAAGMVQPDDAQAWSRYLLARGFYEKADGQPQAALATYSEMYSACTDAELYDRAVQAAYMATLVTAGPDRVVWSRKAISAAEVSGGNRWLTDLWSSLAWTYEDQGQALEALGAFREAQACAEQLTDAHLKLKTEWALAHGLRMAGQLQEARVRASRSLARAERLYTQRREPNDAEWIAHSQRELAEIDVLEGQPDIALTRLITARKRFMEAGIRELAPDSLARLERRIAEVRALTRQ
jgi:tetratricopeptide (TPR) repeat protein